MLYSGLIHWETQLKGRMDLDHHRTPLFTALMQQNQEGILMATLDLSRVAQPHYSRPDVFQLIVNDKKQEMV